MRDVALEEVQPSAIQDEKRHNSDEREVSGVVDAQKDCDVGNAVFSVHHTAEILLGKRGISCSMERLRRPQKIHGSNQTCTARNTLINSIAEIVLLG